MAIGIRPEKTTQKMADVFDTTQYIDVALRSLDVLKENIQRIVQKYKNPNEQVSKSSEVNKHLTALRNVLNEATKIMEDIKRLDE